MEASILVLTVASETGVLVEAHWMILRTDICPTFWADTVHVLQRMYQHSERSLTILAYI